MTSKYISQQLAKAVPEALPANDAISQSSVAVVLDNDDYDKASVLLIQRAQSKKDPWSGHMAFPGGRQEPSDSDGLATAKREMYEEVGFNADAGVSSDSVKVVGRLSDINAVSRFTSMNMIVSPYVFLVEHRPSLILNYEVADTVWVPLAYFAELKNRTIKKIKRQDVSMELPCYQITDDQVVWGMTLKMLDELLGIMGKSMPVWQRL